MTGSGSAGLSLFDEVTITSPACQNPARRVDGQIRTVGDFRLAVASLNFDTLACFPYMHNLAIVQCMQ